MGKSGKKTKSDRINALRKQYDAFLDEDKKRKDRNEFILGCLEKMRLYTPAVIPVHHNLGSPQIGKYHFVTQERPEYLRKIRFDDNLILRSRPTDVLADCVVKDEQKILQEISKKYILIPKLRPTNENSVTYYNPSSVSNDTDWRNKYNILDELKKVEKEGSSEVSKDTDITHETFNNRENIDFESMIATPENGKEQKLDINKDPIYDRQENNEKGPVTELQTNNTKSYSDYNIECKNPLEDEQNIIPTKVKNAENKVGSPGLISINQEQTFSDTNKVSNEFYPSGNVVDVKLRNENKNVEKLNNNQVQNVQQIEMKVNNMVPTNRDHISAKVNNMKNEAFAQNNTVKLSNAETVDSNTTVPFIEKENIDLSLKTVETVAHPEESIENLESYAITGQNEPVSENIQQQEYESNNERTIVSDAIPSQIDEFEAEQKGMFYAEETGYNQNVDTTGYNAQNEEYTNEQYSYYNEPQQEQPYYAEINEHEESTERYDPNYEQQYVGNYEENVNVAQYENQQYAADSYENQQEVMNVNYEQQPDQQEMTNGNYYDQQPGQQDLTNLNYEQQPVQQDLTNVNYEQQLGQQDLTNVNYEQQLGQQDLTNVNYEQQLGQQDLTNVNYEQQLGQHDLTNVNYEQQLGQQDLTNVNYEQQLGQQDLTNVNYEQQPVQQDLSNVNYDQQLGQQDQTNVNYEQVPGQQDLTNVNYEQQPVNYDYGHSTHLDNPDQSQIENINTYDSQASELVNYETQQYNEVGEVEHPTIPDQNVYESQQDYVQMRTEQEAIQNMEQQLDGEGYTEIQNTYPSEQAAAVENISDIEPNIKVT
ncbi:putative mediator of RNA polymerase II transcription subunit 26 isoform X2 [Maniola jurtina]|uniref:putative mediator of RNA polymerase II transcription subunit 26 isoform X2 n=1 Tax=Maniola jurtina TaxID=191418 RepID=UPI001E68802F|nr:putative mediator of RNA polymerase II transcription subunit 26 isoform X2 [Maniola jurtina]